MSIQDYERAKRKIILELELIDEHLKGVLDNPQLKNSRDVIELQIERLTYLDALRFLRPENKKDKLYRTKIFETFPTWIQNHVSDRDRFVFHGTTLANTERILNSGKITSGKDRWTIHTSGDDSGEISVTTHNYLETSLRYHMDLVETYKDYEYCVPAGSLFVLKISKEEYQRAKDQQRIHNIYFKRNPQQLYAVITTPENLNRVKWWMQKNNFSSDKVCDFKEFQKRVKQNSFHLFSSEKNNKNTLI